MTPSCLCANVKLQGEVVGRNCNPDCPLHGHGTDYWQEHIVPTIQRSVEMQRRARETRNAVSPEECPG